MIDDRYINNLAKGKLGLCCFLFASFVIERKNYCSRDPTH